MDMFNNYDLLCRLLSLFYDKKQGWAYYTWRDDYLLYCNKWCISIERTFNYLLYGKSHVLIG